MQSIFEGLYSTNKQSSKRGHNKFEVLSCNPGAEKDKILTESCLDKPQIKRLKLLWNKRHPDHPIKSSKIKDIYDELKQNLNGSCSNEQCWVGQLVKDSDKKQELLEQTFAPSAPKSWISNINEWLSSVDITRVMKQYEDEHPDFKFIGPSPIDFNEMIGNNECVWPELCNISIKELLRSGKTKIGFVFNTDPHYKSGSHWISMYMDIGQGKNDQNRLKKELCKHEYFYHKGSSKRLTRNKNKTSKIYNSKRKSNKRQDKTNKITHNTMKKGLLFFFDSNGTKIPNELAELTAKLVRDCAKNNIELKVCSNEGFRHQMTNTECGMYSLYFIISLLTNKRSFSYFKTRRIPDKVVESLRRKYFNISERVIF